MIDAWSEKLTLHSTACICSTKHAGKSKLLRGSRGQSCSKSRKMISHINMLLWSLSRITAMRAYAPLIWRNVVLRKSVILPAKATLASVYMRKTLTRVIG